MAFKVSNLPSTLFLENSKNFKPSFSISNNSLEMAYATRACLFFLLMIFSYEIVCIKGRSLRQQGNLPSSCANCVSSNTMGSLKSGAVASPSELQWNARSLEGYVDAFRPTTPSHSPGVGHSVHN